MILHKLNKVLKQEQEDEFHLLFCLNRIFFERQITENLMCASLTFPKVSRCDLIFGASVSQKYSYFEQFHSKLHIEKY